MVLEVVSIKVKDGKEEEYEEALRQASKYISRAKGYVNHELKSCVEEKGKYLLLVQWKLLEDHTIGFRQSSDYQEWRSLTHPFYEGALTVEHFENVSIKKID